MKWDKEFYTVGAVWKMLKNGKIDKDCAIYLLKTRAKVKPAKETVELWLTSYPMRHLKAGLNQ